VSLWLVAASGGVQAALRLARLPVEVTLVDRNNYFLFQLLAYQVATGGLSPAEIAYPLRRIFRRHRNVRVILAEVTDFDLEARIVQLSPVEGPDAPASLAFDTLVVVVRRRSLQLLRSRGMGSERDGPQDARERIDGPAWHPGRVRGGRARA